MPLPDKFTFINKTKNSKCYGKELEACKVGFMDAYWIVELGSFTVEAVEGNIKDGWWVMKVEEEPKEPEMYIVSNQIICKNCGDSIYSMHRHHYVTCSCGSCSVDGGQDYLKRVGSGWEDVSITIEKDALEKLATDVKNSIDSGRNPVGVTLAALRSIRDHNIKQEGLQWILDE